MVDDAVKVAENLAKLTVVESKIIPTMVDVRATATSPHLLQTLEALAQVAHAEDSKQRQTKGVKSKNAHKTIQVCSNGHNDCHTTASMFALASLRHLSQEVKELVKKDTVSQAKGDHEKKSETTPIVSLLSYVLFNMDEAATYIQSRKLQAAKLMEKVRGKSRLLANCAH